MHGHLKFVYLISFIFFVGCTDSDNQPLEERILKENNLTISPSSSAGKDLQPLPSAFPEINQNPEDLNSSTEVENEALVSIERRFYSDGSIKEEISLFGDIKEGPRRRWHPNGNLSREGVMKADKWNGVYREWYSDGSPKLKGYYKAGKQEGEWLFFDKEGEALPSLFYKDGTEVTRDLPKVFGN